MVFVATTFLCHQMRFGCEVAEQSLLPLSQESPNRELGVRTVSLSTRLHPRPTRRPMAQRLATRARGRKESAVFSGRKSQPHCMALTQVPKRDWHLKKALPASWWLVPNDYTSFQLEAQQILVLPSYTRKHSNFKHTEDHNKDCVRSQELHSIKPRQSRLCNDHEP